jgi:hypothetical protein
MDSAAIVAADGRFSTVAMLDHRAFAADLLVIKVNGEFAALLSRSLDARLGWRSLTRSLKINGWTP